MSTTTSLSHVFVDESRRFRLVKPATQSGLGVILLTNDSNGLDEVNSSPPILAVVLFDSENDDAVEVSVTTLAVTISKKRAPGSPLDASEATPSPATVPV